MRQVRPGALRRLPRRLRGSATVEYTVVAALAVVVLVTGPNVMSEVITAVREMYEAFSYAVGLTYPAPDSFGD